jgi:integrase
MLKFLNGKDIRIEKINAGLMKSFEHYLLTENKSRNTVSCYMRSLRAAYNQALVEKVIDTKKTSINPFVGVFTGYSKTQKRAISVENIMKLQEVKVSYMKLQEGGSSTLKPINRSILQSLDLFMFSLYTQGMNFSDMVNLKKENIKDGVIRYKRKKTGQMITVALEECIKVIIRDYSVKNSDYLFPILRSSEHRSESKKWENTRSALAKHNKNLKKLARMAGIEDRLTSYSARHSWASLASHVGIPLATISRGMGHESERTTQIYISQLDYSDVRRANKQILSCFNWNFIPEMTKCECNAGYNHGYRGI